VTLITDIRNLITRRKSALAIDIAEPQVDEAAEEVEVADDVEVVEAVEVDHDYVSQIEPAPGAPDAEVVAVVEGIGNRVDAQGERMKGQARQLTTQGEQLSAQGKQLSTQGEQLSAQREQLNAQDEKLNLQGEQLDAQTTQVQKMNQHMEQLPLVLKETAEIKGQCAQVIELVGAQAGDARGRDEAVTETITRAVNDAVAGAADRLAEASSKDEKVLERIQRQLEVNTKAFQMTGDAEDGIQRKIDELRDSTSKLRQTVQSLVTAGEGRDAQVAAQLAATKKSMMQLAFACALASLMALVVAVIALVM
jgi:chromosome segregation ATPase